MDERQYDDIQFAAHRQHLKRRREPDQNRLIVLGNPIHSGLKPHLCDPMIKRRCIDPSGRCSSDPSILNYCMCAVSVCMLIDSHLTCQQVIMVHVNIDSDSIRLRNSDG